MKSFLFFTSRDKTPIAQQEKKWYWEISRNLQEVWISKSVYLFSPGRSHIYTYN